MSAVIGTSELSEVQSIEIREQRVPSRVVHFSDGIVEEFSDEDTDDTTDTAPADDDVDESKMSWGPWLWLKAGHGGSAVLERCDTAGEALAAFLGITSPKYGYELDVYKRLQAERAARANEDAEAANWAPVRQDESGERTAPATVQPQPNGGVGGDDNGAPEQVLKF